MCPDLGAVDHLDRVVAAAVGLPVEHQVPQATGSPTAALPVHGVPVPEFLRQIAPRRAGAGNPEDRVQRAPVVTWRAAA